MTHVNDNCCRLSEYFRGFEKLQAIAYKDIFINGTCLRNLGIHYMNAGVDWNVKKHKHSFFEFHYVAEGNVYTAINGMEYEICAGCFYVMPPGTYHSHRQAPGTSHMGFALRWETSQEERKSGVYQNSSHELDRINKIVSGAHSQPVHDNRSIISCMLELLVTAEHGGRMLELQLGFLRLIMRISDFYFTGLYLKDGRLMSDKVNPAFLENGIVDNAIRFIEENYSQNIDVNDISLSVHLSYSHLSRLFKQYTGETINYHLNKIRLSRAQKLLQCSDKNIAQIAREVGFNSEYYFCSIFKKFYKISPGSYRRSKISLSE